jgi:predicted metal-dependent hydrolase
VVAERWRPQEGLRRPEGPAGWQGEAAHIIDDWSETKGLEAFFADAEQRAQDLPDEQRERTIERLLQARALIGSTDALERFNAWRAPEER